MCHIFFIHSSDDGHLGCFHVLAIVNRAAMNILVHDSFWSMVFSGYMPSSGIAVSYGSSFFFLFFIFYLFFYSQVKNISTSSYILCGSVPEDKHAAVLPKSSTRPRIEKDYILNWKFSGPLENYTHKHQYLFLRLSNPNSFPLRTLKIT